MEWGRNFRFGIPIDWIDGCCRRFYLIGRGWPTCLPTALSALRRVQVGLGRDRDLLEDASMSMHGKITNPFVLIRGVGVNFVLT